MSALDIAGISGVVGAAVAGLGAYLFTEPFMIRVRELELSFPNLPPAFDGYTILHLSDLHITKHGLLEKKTMALISGRQVDVCFITGDVTVQPRASDTFRRVCSAIDLSLIHISRYHAYNHPVNGYSGVPEGGRHWLR